jgi:hypothetical protein
MSGSRVIKGTRRRLGAAKRRIRAAVPAGSQAAGPPSGGRGRYSARDLRTIRRIRRTYERLSVPLITVFFLHDKRFHPSYGLTWRRRLRLVRQMERNTRRVQTGTSYRAHVAMASKIFAIPPQVEGVLVEAGCWKGGTTANLSLIADIVGRDLVVYDSFEGLPAPATGDRWASPLGEGAFRGELEEVRHNVTTYGAIRRCQFRKGWFSDTMGDHTEPIVFAFVDVDHQASMHQCMLGLWPHLVDQGYWFIDEYVRLDYCALFFSERYWRTYFDRPPPGLMGAGTGIPVGQYFTGPYRERPPMQEPSSIGWTRKDFYGEWDYFPDDGDVTPLPGGPGAAHGVEGWTTTTLPSEETANRKLAEKLASTPEGRAAVERVLKERAEAAARAEAQSDDEGDGSATEPPA